MQCSFCHSYLGAAELRQKQQLQLCCGLNQIFCLRCLFSPSIIETAICANTPLTCHECARTVAHQQLLAKRLRVDLGSYAGGHLQLGYTCFLGPRTAANPETPKKYYGFSTHASLCQQLRGQGAYSGHQVKFKSSLMSNSCSSTMDQKTTPKKISPFLTSPEFSAFKSAQ